MKSLAVSLISPERLNLPIGLMSDHRIGGIQYIGGGAIVLFKLDRLCFGIYLLEIEDVTDIRTPELIYGLVIITYHTDIMMRIGQKSYKLKLHGIGILILIHTYISEPVLISTQHFFVFFEKLHTLKQQIVKIERIILTECLLILLIALSYTSENEIAPITSRIFIRSHHLILRR